MPMAALQSPMETLFVFTAYAAPAAMLGHHVAKRCLTTAFFLTDSATMLTAVLHGRCMTWHQHNILQPAACLPCVRRLRKVLCSVHR